MKLVVDRDGTISMSVGVHAPRGGATIAGKHFTGGEFIPKGVLAQASAEDKAKLKPTRAGYEAVKGNVVDTGKVNPKTNKPVFKKADDKYVHAGGEGELTMPMLQRIRTLKIPPGHMAKGVVLARDPKAKIQAVATDAQGKDHYFYRADHHEQAAVAKWKRVAAFMAKGGAFDKLQANVDKAIHGPDSPLREAALVLAFMAHTGIRVDSEGAVDARVKSYGASTLEPRHVQVDGDTVHYDFIGKEGVRNYGSFSNPLIAREIERRIKQDRPKLFGANYGAVTKAFKQLGGGGFLVKDLRTAVANETAYHAIEGMPAPKTPEEYQAQRIRVGQIVGRKLNHAAERGKEKIGPDGHPLSNHQMSLDNYINPEVFIPWKANLERQGFQVSNDSEKQSKPSTTSAPKAKSPIPSSGTPRKPAKTQWAKDSSPAAKMALGSQYLALRNGYITLVDRWPQGTTGIIDSVFHGDSEPEDAVRQFRGLLYGQRMSFVFIGPKTGRQRVVSSRGEIPKTILRSGQFTEHKDLEEHEIHKLADEADKAFHGLTVPQHLQDQALELFHLGAAGHTPMDKVLERFREIAEQARTAGKKTRGEKVAPPPKVEATPKAKAVTPTETPQTKGETKPSKSVSPVAFHEAMKARSQPGTVVLVRVGDFYHTYSDDAKKVAGILGLTVTTRSQKGKPDIAMAGFPHHALDGHLRKLFANGVKVAVADLDQGMPAALPEQKPAEYNPDPSVAAKRWDSTINTLIKSAMRKITPEAHGGALVSIRDLRKHFNPASLDKALLEMAAQGKIALHKHDLPASLSPAERAALLKDAQGNEYVGVALRPSGNEKSRSTPQGGIESAMAKLNPEAANGAAVSIAELRKASGNPDGFDKMLLDLEAKGKLRLHRTGEPGVLGSWDPAAGGGQGVTDRGRTYVGVSRVLPKWDQVSKTDKNNREFTQEQFNDELKAAFDKLDKAGGNRGYLFMADLRKVLPHYTSDQLNAGIRELRMQNKYTMEASEGNVVKLTPEQQEAGITEAGRRLVYLRRIKDDREPDQKKSEESVATEAGPKDGDRDEAGLVFKGGRWHREEEGQAAEKEPHEMTREEYRKYFDGGGKNLLPMMGADVSFSMDWGRKNFGPDTKNRLLHGDAGDTQHLLLIANQLRQGKPVPPEVLADYPDLAPKQAAEQEGEPVGGNKARDMDRATPRKGESARQELEDAVDAAWNDYSRYDDEVDAARRFRDGRQSRYSAAYEKADKAYKSTVEKRDAAHRKHQELAEKQNVAILEDLAESDHPIKSELAKLHLMERGYIGEHIVGPNEAKNAERYGLSVRDAMPQIKKAKEKKVREKVQGHVASLATAVAFAADGQGRLPKEEDEAAVNLAVADVVRQVMGSPSMFDKAADKLAGSIRGERLKSYRELASMKLNALEHRIEPDRTRDMYDFDEIDKHVTSHIERDKAEKQRKKDEAAAKKTAAKKFIEDFAEPGTHSEKPHTVAQVGKILREASSRFRYDFVATARESGWASDGKFMLKLPDKDREKIPDANTGGRILPLATINTVLMDRGSGYRVNVTGSRMQPVGIHDEPSKDVQVRFGEGKDAVVANAKYHATIMSRYPNAEMRLGKQPNTIVYLSDGEPVGVLIGFELGRGKTMSLQQHATFNIDDIMEEIENILQQVHDGDMTEEEAEEAYLSLFSEGQAMSLGGIRMAYVFTGPRTGKERTVSTLGAIPKSVRASGKYKEVKANPRAKSDLHGKTVRQLRELASKEGHKGHTSQRRKDDLVKFIESARKAAAKGKAGAGDFRKIAKEVAKGKKLKPKKPKAAAAIERKGNKLVAKPKESHLDSIADALVKLTNPSPPAKAVPAPEKAAKPKPLTAVVGGKPAPAVEPKLPPPHDTKGHLERMPDHQLFAMARGQNKYHDPAASRRETIAALLNTEKPIDRLLAERRAEDIKERNYKPAGWTDTGRSWGVQTQTMSLKKSKVARPRKAVAV